MGQRITVVDAFTHTAFAGNPAAVCVLSEKTTDAWMQSVAAEMKHSETAFCIRVRDGSFELRWFTPGGEVRLCGHATLAAAHVLWEEGWLEHRNVARFSTLSGELTAAPLGRVIELDFPVRPAAEVEAPAGLIEALGVTPSWIGRDLEDYIVLLADEAAAGLGDGEDVHDSGVLHDAGRQAARLQRPPASGDERRPGPGPGPVFLGGG